MRHLNVLVADNHPIYALGLQTALADPAFDFDIQIKGIANSSEEMRALLYQNDPDLLLLDLALPEFDGLQLLPSVKKEHANIRILVLAGHPTVQMAQAALAAGADGFMPKSGTKHELFEAIAQIIDGKKFLGETNTTVYANTADPLSAFAEQYGLTSREIEILRHIAQAKDNHQIGAELFISFQTVSVHRKNIMRKLNVNSTANLIKIVFENRLFT